MDPATMMLAVKGGIALYQQVQGMSKKKEAEAAAQRAAAQMRSIKEKDVYGNLQVPTLGAELARQANAQNTATAMGVLQSVGAIGVLGGVTNIANASTDKILQISAMLQNAEYEKDKFVFQQQQELENRNINRQLQMAGMELRGAQSAVSEAKMMKQNAALLGGEAVTGYAVMKMKEAPLYEKGTLGTGKLSTEEQSIVNKRLAEGGMKLEDLKNLSPEQYPNVMEAEGFTSSEQKMFPSGQKSLDEAMSLEGVPTFNPASEFPFSPYAPKQKMDTTPFDYTPLYMPQLQPAPNLFPILPPGLR
jgi:hypothetical protein